MRTVPEAGVSRRRVHSLRRVLFLAMLTVLAGCAGDPPPPGMPTVALAPAPHGEAGTVALLTHGWHTDIAVPVGEISGPLTMFVRRFPGAKNIVFGYGKRSFMVSREHTAGDWLDGPFPGRGAVEVSAIAADPAAAYGARHTMTIDLPPGGAARLSAFIWQSLAKDAAGRPVEVAPGGFKGSHVFAATSGYDLSHTCNTWSAQALAFTGLGIRWTGITFSSQIDAEARRFAVPPSGS